MPQATRALAIPPSTFSARAETGSEAEKLRLRVWLRLLSSARAIETEIRARLRVDFETTLPRFDVLAQLDSQRNGLTMGELSVRLKVTSGNVTGLIDAMEYDGLVARKQHRTDRRSTVIVATARGKRFFANMAPVHHGWVDEILGEMSDGDLATLMRLLDKVRASTKLAIAK